MPQYIDASTQTYLGAYNPNVTSAISIDLALTAFGDFFFDPSGNLNNVSGNQKLIQDVMLFLLSPVGSSIIDANWGNPVLSLMGTAETRPGQLEELVKASVSILKQYKDREQQTRHTEASELIASINDVIINQVGQTGNAFEIEIHLTTHNQNQTIARLPLGSGT